jgi:hypothetical protein
MPTTLDCPPVTDAEPPLDHASGPGPIVPVGAVSARLCSHTPTPDPRYRYRDVVLTHGVGGLVDRLNRLEEFDPSRTCPKDGGTPYLLVLGYPTGQRVMVLVSGVGCNEVRIGDQARYDPGYTVLNEFEKLAG